KDMPVSEHIAKAQTVGGSLLASVNGALFNAYYNARADLTFPDNCARTYGVLISNGQAVKGAGTIPMLGFTSDGKALIDNVKIDVRVSFRSGQSIGMWAVNDYYNDATSIVLITPECGYPVPLQSGAMVVHVKNGMVDNIEHGLSSVSCAADEKLVIYNAGSWQNAVTYNQEPRPGNSAEINTLLTPEKAETQDDWNRIVTAVGSKPWLLQNGVDVFERNGSMEEKMGKDFNAQRTFAAILPDGSLMIGETTASFGEIISYLQSIGARDALALDGGASSMLHSGGNYLQNAGRKLTNVLHIIDFSNSGNIPTPPPQNDASEPSAWARPFIDTAYENGLIPEGFDLAPKTNITRAEFCQLAYTYVEKKLGSEKIKELLNASPYSYAQAQENFDDIANNYHNVIVQSFRLGIVSGKGAGKFDPNGSITRQEAATMLTKAAKLVGIEASGEPVTFADAASISAWATDFVDFAARAGIMAGTGDNFDPLGYFTKEQAITTFTKIF
ncbi:MAG TPA: S-layer homology domain-containing protein, partial [Bacillota bacterium]|nr:S-layer homology domain-containing protein [Bacillota bacterium]